MTRLYRVLSLLEAYDALINIAIPNDVCDYLTPYIESMREEKEKLTQELIEHKCGDRYYTSYETFR